MNLQELRDAVRSQVDLDDEELPDSMVDLYLRDAFQQTISRRQNWPFYEASWMVAFDNVSSVQVPADLDSVVRVRLLPTNQPLDFIDHMFAEQRGLHSLAGGQPSHWSVFAGQMHLWPPPGGGLLTVNVAGYRKPSDWVSSGPSAEPDCDERLVVPMVWFACSLVYAYQEDEVLENQYAMRFERSVSAVINDVMRVRDDWPKVVFGGYTRGMVPTTTVHLVT